MYNSPITIYEDLNALNAPIIEHQENIVMEQIKMFVDVNKEELVKALAYDRKQYEAGYNDGFIDGRKKTIEDITNILGIM